MKKNDIKTILKYAGASIAWVIGSGFATGQEILQFFSSYSRESAWVLAVDLIGFIALSVILIAKGHDHRGAADFNHYEYYCGKAVGKVYSVIIPVTLVLIISVLISAAGATLNQYCGVNRYLGSLLMAALLLAAYLIGFEKMVQVVSSISPFVIVFVMFVGGFTVFRDSGEAQRIGAFAPQLAAYRVAPHWLVSAVLYLSLNFLCGSTYYTALGKAAENKRAAIIGTILGAVVLLVTIAAMNYAILFNAEGILTVSVPTLYLAQRISGVFGTVFSVVLMLGMFSSCSTMLWSFCSGFFKHDRQKNRWFAVATVAVCAVLGFVPFGELVSTVYPLIGYAGLVFIGGVLVHMKR